MHRPITGFATDSEGDWVALLSCGHPQHVRHRPPFFDRTWVTTEDGRAAMLGKPLDCIRCDRLEIPDGFVAYKQTAVFTESTVPKGLLNDHNTRPGIWGKIVVLEGSLRYLVPALGLAIRLSPETHGVVAPEVIHHLEPVGAVRFYIAFHRAPEPA